MSNCDVCIGTYDYDGPEFWKRSAPKARKPHRCCECNREIQRGETYQLDTGRWDGDFNTYRTCAQCAEIRDVFTCGGGWLYRSLWEDMEMAFDDLRMAGECWDELSAAAKAHLLVRWRAWRGLAV